MDLCFGPGRTLLSSYRLRDGVPPAADLCLVARGDAGEVAGAIRFWPVRVGGRWDAMLLGPVAVHPTRQGEGLGAFLIQSGLDRGAGGGRRARAAGRGRALLRAVRFRRLDGVVMPPPTNPDRVLGIWDWDGMRRGGGSATRQSGLAAWGLAARRSAPSSVA